MGLQKEDGRWRASICSRRVEVSRDVGSEKDGKISEDWIVVGSPRQKGLLFYRQGYPSCHLRTGPDRLRGEQEGAQAEDRDVPREQQEYN